VSQKFRNSTRQKLSYLHSVMKSQKIVLFLVAILGLLTMSSCTVYTDASGRPIGVGPQSIVAGTGMSPRGPIGGYPVVTGGAVFGACGPNGPFGFGGARINQLPQQWGRVYPYGSQCSPGHPNNFYQGGGPAAWNQRFGPPPCQPRPGCYNPYTQRW
jgi:hypothetical protein